MLAESAAPTPQSPEETERLNDSLASEYSINDYYERSPLVVRWIERGRLRIIRDMVAEDPGVRILEIGSGGGHVLRQFKRAKLTAVDVSGKFLDIARENLRGYDAEFIKGEIDRLALPASSFDRIICTEVLEHVADPARILREMARLLKPGGRAVITVPNDPLINRGKAMVQMMPLAGAIMGRRLGWGGDHFHLHQWRPREFEAYVSQFLTVERRAAAPFDWLPVRVCFLCRKPGAT